MSKVILFIFFSVLLLLLVPMMTEAADNVTLITKVIGDNVTIHLITKVIPNNNVKIITLYTHVIEGQYSQVQWWGCCGDDWGYRNDVPRGIPLNFLSVFPNMVTGIANPATVCNDIRAEILRIEPSSVTAGTPVDVVFVVESSCNYVGNISLLLNGQINQTLGTDLSQLRNRTYRTTIMTSGLQIGVQKISILGAVSTFNVVGNVVPTTIAPPQVVSQPTVPVERAEDKIFFWVAIAIGGIILVTVILLVLFR